jgi:DNA-binding LacI/PurR family transcriptional regulator
LEQVGDGQPKPPLLLGARTCDGLLIHYNAEIPARLEELAACARVPTVWMNSKHAHNCVYPDDFGAAQSLVTRLIAAGHRHIAYADYTRANNCPSPHYSNADRFGGYERALRRHGLAPRRLDTDHFMERPERVAHSAAWLARRDAPTAVLCYTRQTAESIAHAMRLAGGNGRRGKRVEVFAFDAFCGDDGPYEWTALEIPMNRMGCEATRLLLALMDDPLKKAPPLALPFTLPPVT